MNDIAKTTVCAGCQSTIASDYSVSIHFSGVPRCEAVVEEQICLCRKCRPELLSALLELIEKLSEKFIGTCGKTLDIKDEGIQDDTVGN